MGYCVKCGMKVEDYVRVCPQCGAEIPVIGNRNDYNAGYPGGGDYFRPEEVKRNKGMGVLSYLGILVLIPLLAGDRRSEYVKFHSGQGLVLFLVSSIIDLMDGKWVFGLHSWLNFGGGVFSTVFDILGFACFILMIAGIVSACRGERRELPIIGKIRVFR